MNTLALALTVSKLQTNWSKEDREAFPPVRRYSHCPEYVFCFPDGCPTFASQARNAAGGGQNVEMLIFERKISTMVPHGLSSSLRAEISLDFSISMWGFLQQKLLISASKPLKTTNSLDPSGKSREIKFEIFKFEESFLN